ncbi:MAG TPA: hypothetical protein VM166_13370, partial [Gemmatimonadaceae bacterium]|nr:hypothetical protein [Gemmatimonadaceae bacterium]
MRVEFVVLAGAAFLCSCSSKTKTDPGADSSFAKVQRQGAAVMGVDQYTSQHVFESLPDGGRIVLEREENDPTGEAAIRAHMRTIAEAFRRGDFSLPGVVHSMSDVPGTSEMRRLSTDITYTPRDLPRGGELLISTKNAAAVAAIHEFLAFQNRDH